MTTKTILVTGANRGIGYSIVQALATRFPSCNLLLAAREKGNAAQAAAQLRKEVGITANIEPIVLDITNDASIAAARHTIESCFNGRLDVLINNAAIAPLPNPADLAKNRASFAAAFDTNVTSVYHVTRAFLRLLKATPNPVVVNISSARGSMTRSSTMALPPTEVVAYSVSKAALNSLTLELMKQEPGVKFYAANPGHCKTAFNGYRGQRDPLEGANVVVALVVSFQPHEPYEVFMWLR